MKKLITLLILLFAINISAQDQSANVMSSKNYSATALDSAGTYTGLTEIVRGYNSFSVNIKSNRDGYYKVLWGNNSTLTLSNATRIDSVHYEENDYHTTTFGVVAPYLKIIYYNAPYAQTSFSLIVMLNRGETLPRNTLGIPKVTIESSPTAGEYLATTTKQDSIITLFGSVKTTIEFAASSQAASTEWFGFTDTMTVSVDTVVFTGHTGWAEVEIKANDSLEVSLVGAFTTGKTLIITETTAVKLPRWDLGHYSTLYIRRYGSAGTVTFYLRASAY